MAYLPKATKNLGTSNAATSHWWEGGALYPYLQFTPHTSRRSMVKRMGASIVWGLKRYLLNPASILTPKWVIPVGTGKMSQQLPEMLWEECKSEHLSRKGIL